MLQVYVIMLFPDSHKHNPKCFGAQNSYTQLRTDFKLYHKLLFHFILLKQIEATVQQHAGVC